MGPHAGHPPFRIPGIGFQDIRAPGSDATVLETADRTRRSVCDVFRQRARVEEESLLKAAGARGDPTRGMGLVPPPTKQNGTNRE